MCRRSYGVAIIAGALMVPVTFPQVLVGGRPSRFLNYNLEQSKLGSCILEHGCPFHPGPHPTRRQVLENSALEVCSHAGQ